jgi:hypothetical protein
MADGVEPTLAGLGPPPRAVQEREKNFRPASRSSDSMPSSTGWPAARRGSIGAARLLDRVIADFAIDVLHLSTQPSAIIVADRCDGVVRALSELDDARIRAMAAKARAITLACHTGLNGAATLDAEIAAQMQRTEKQRLAKTGQASRTLGLG